MKYKGFLFVGQLLLTFTVAVQAGDYLYTTNNGTIIIGAYTGSGGAVTIPSTLNGRSVTGLGDLAFRNGINISSVTIPNSITNIGSSVFYGCTKLNNVIIPNSVKSIGIDSFAYCISLANITIGNGITSIGNLFTGCTNLTSATIGDNFATNGTTSIGQVAFQYLPNLASVTIGNSVTRIGISAFDHCSRLTSITIPNSVTNIGGWAFYLCTSLTNAVIGNGITSIEGAGTFSSCTSLVSVTIGNSVTNIGEMSFYACTRLTNVMIPTNVTSIESSAFAFCTNRTGIYFQGNAPSLGSHVFDDNGNAIVYYLPRTTGWDSTFGEKPAVLWNPVYLLTINGGTGGGAYTNQQRVTIAADEPATGKTFDRWNGATQYVASVTESTTTVTMPSTITFMIPTEDVTLTATYKDVYYALTVTDGSGDGLYTYQQAVVINADAPSAGTIFDRWIGDTQYVTSVTTSTTTVTMPPQEATLTATYKNVYTLTVNSGSGGGSLYTNLQQVVIEANAPPVGKTFDLWSGDTQYVESVTSSTTTVTMPAQAITLTATYKDVYYTLTVTCGSGGGSYIYQQQITIEAEMPPTGKTFDRWIGDTQYVASVTSSSTTVTIPLRDVTLATTYKNLYCTLTVESVRGTAIPCIGINSYLWGSVVICSVDTVVTEGLTNWICLGWTGTGDVPSSGNDSTTGPIILTNLNSSITWNWPAKTVSDLWAENVTATQRPGTKLVELHYDIHSTKINSVNVSLSAANETGAVPSFAISGDVGSVATGTGKTVIWDAGADWDGNLDNLTFRILGQDSQGAVVATSTGCVKIPAGENSGTDPDGGAYIVSATNSLFMDASENTKAQWDTVVAWAVTNGYSFSNDGSATASNHPVQTVSWYDAAKWCNARSQMDGFVPCYNTNDWSCDFNANGYRLPTAEEWQYAARGGLSGKRFPWGDTITHSNDVYYSSTSYSYDLSTTRGFHPVYGMGTAPEGTGTTNGYGLYAMAGNVMEWCQDTSGVSRALCGGSFDQYASEARCAYKSWAAPTTADYNIGFRTVQRASSSASAETGSAVPVDTRDYLLTVSSEHGTPIPSIGTNRYAWRSTVTCSVDSAVTSGHTNWTSAGWSGIGSVPTEGGTANTGSITLTGLVSSIVWNWNTNYWLAVATSGSGSVNPSSGWRPAGANFSLTVSPSNGWLFMGWSGDASGDYTATNIIVPMVRPVSVTATFSDDADGDGLLNTNETALGTNPRSKDSDGDGMDDPKELVAGTSPTNSASVLKVLLSTGGSANEISWYGVSGRYYRLEYTDSLTNGWTPKGTVITGANAQIMKLDISTDASRFYRIRVSDSPSGFN